MKEGIFVLEEYSKSQSGQPRLVLISLISVPKTRKIVQRKYKSAMVSFPLLQLIILC